MDALPHQIATNYEFGAVTYSYDASGNRVAKRQDFGQRVTLYSYDAENRLEAVSEGDRLLLAALYDGNNNRIFTATPSDSSDQPLVAEAVIGKKKVKQKTSAGDTRTASVMGNSSAETTSAFEPVIAGLDTAISSTAETPRESSSDLPAQTPDLFWYGVLQGLFRASHL